MQVVAYDIDIQHRPGSESGPRDALLTMMLNLLLLFLYWCLIFLNPNHSDFFNLYFHLILRVAEGEGEGLLFILTLPSTRKIYLEMSRMFE